MDLILLGALLGLAAGISPGPLLALVVASSLERGFGAGLRVAIAPLLTDAPIIVLVVWVLEGMPETLLAGVGAVGGCCVIYFGLRTLRTNPSASEPCSAQGGSRDLARGAAVNFLNPHPWLFWATVQGPLLLRAWRQSPLVGLGFIGSFYLTIVTSKVIIAAIVARGRRELDQQWYRRLLHSCGIVLVALGGWLVIQSLTRVL